MLLYLLFPACFPLFDRISNYPFCTYPISLMDNTAHLESLFLLFYIEPPVAEKHDFNRRHDAT